MIREYQRSGQNAAADFTQSPDAWEDYVDPANFLHWSGQYDRDTRTWRRVKYYIFYCFLMCLKQDHILSDVRSNLPDEIRSSGIVVLQNGKIVGEGETAETMLCHAK